LLKRNSAEYSFVAAASAVRGVQADQYCLHVHVALHEQCHVRNAHKDAGKDALKDFQNFKRRARHDQQCIKVHQSASLTFCVSWCSALGTSWICHLTLPALLLLGMRAVSSDLTTKAVLAWLALAKGNLVLPSNSEASLTTLLRGSLVSLLVAEFLLPTAWPALTLPFLLLCPWADSPLRPSRLV
jgi:hypothetical protein